MEAIYELLSPDQIDAIVGAYDSIANWYDQLTIILTDTVARIGVDDVII